VSGSIYTLLIVESPVLAKTIQQVAPSSVYVMATGGFCWKPDYNAENNTLRAIADPDKLEFRKELKEQAKWAGNIVVASDSDPSGDFIAWSVSRFLKSSVLLRGSIRRISKSGIVQTLTETTRLNDRVLEQRLKNRYLIRQIWNSESSLPEFEHAAIASVFSSSVPYTRFLDEKGHEYRSSQPLTANPDEWIQVRPNSGLNEFKSYKPLSTFDVLEMCVSEGLAPNYHQAQELLQELFQTTLPSSNEALISYPRTDSNAFYSETWDALRTQYLTFGNQNSLKPIFLQEIADADEPHESIHPMRLDLTPVQAEGELKSGLANLYRRIYEETVKALTIPEELKEPLTNDFNPELFFYPVGNNGDSHPDSIRPVRNASDTGHRLVDLQLVSPSRYGELLDRWISGQLLSLNSGYLSPGKKLSPYMNSADRYHNLFRQLKALMNDTALSPETVKRVLTS
jgi:hypothetical protein